MTNLHPAPRDQAAETLYWLNFAKRILRGDIQPDEALHVLRLGTLNLEASDAGKVQAPTSAAGPSAKKIPR
jgi:hypothetical protein